MAKGNSNAIVYVVIAIVLAAVGYWLWKKKKSETPKSDEPLRSSAVPPAAAVKLANQAADVALKTAAPAVQVNSALPGITIPVKPGTPTVRPSGIAPKSSPARTTVTNKPGPKGTTVVYRKPGRK